MNLQLEGFEELVVLGLGPAFSGLGDGVGLPDLLRRIVGRRRRGGGRRRRGGDCGEGAEAGQRHSVGVQVEALGRVRVFGYHTHSHTQTVLGFFAVSEEEHPLNYSLSLLWERRFTSPFGNDYTR